MNSDDILKIYMEVNNLGDPDDAGPLDRGICIEFAEACYSTEELLYPNLLDSTALQIIRDICRLVDSLKTHHWEVPAESRAGPVRCQCEDDDCPEHRQSPDCANNADHVVETEESTFTLLCYPCLKEKLTIGWTETDLDFDKDGNINCPHCGASDGAHFSNCQNT